MATGNTIGHSGVSWPPTRRRGALKGPCERVRACMRAARLQVGVCAVQRVAQAIIVERHSLALWPQPRPAHCLRCAWVRLLLSILIHVVSYVQPKVEGHSARCLGKSIEVAPRPVALGGVQRKGGSPHPGFTGATCSPRSAVCRCGFVTCTPTMRSTRTRRSVTPPVLHPEVGATGNVPLRSATARRRSHTQSRLSAPNQTRSL